MGKQSFSFCSLNKKLNVSSVKFVRSCKYILAGIGGELCVLNYSQPVLFTTKINVLDNNIIHGIIWREDEAKLCVYGGQFISLLEANYDADGLRLSVCHKWRLRDRVLCCLWVTRQTSLVLATLSAHNELVIWDSFTATKLSSVSCLEKPLLHSAELIASTGGIVVIAGTVFQHIVVWTVADNCTDEQSVIHRLKGHKGVIFSLRYNDRSRLISSTSDDRSVRVWAVNSPHQGSLTLRHWAQAQISLVYTIFGHTARVWQSYVLQDNSVVSIGEDAQMCVWAAGGGECLTRHQAHQGAPIWSMDVDETCGLVVTGGGDGGVSLFPLAPFPLAQPLQAPPLPPCRIALLPGSKALVTTDAGSILWYEADHWTNVFTDERIANYCLMETSPSRKLVALATINGCIIVLRCSDFSTMLDIQVNDGKVFSLHWLSENTLLSCHAQGNLKVLEILKSSKGLEEMASLILPDCRERWTTCCVLSGATIVVGDRMGNIHSAPANHTTINVNMQSVAGAHSRLGVCSLTAHQGLVWSSGRDGKVHQFSVEDHKLSLISTLRLPIDWVARLIHLPNLETMVLSFHESSVVVWGEGGQRRLAALPCGGGHRSWDCLIEDEQFSFTFLKVKQAHLFQCPLSAISRPTLMKGFHVREVNCAAVVGGEWVITGGEDGSVRVSRSVNANWETCAVARSHLSSVRALCVAVSPIHVFVFSGGGRAQLKAWRLVLGSRVSLVELSSFMQREERKGRHWLNTSPVADPETRYMDLHTFPLSDNILCVLASCSDALLRIFHFNSDTSELQLHGSIKAGDHCLLRVTSFHLDDSPIAVATATDGSVAFWNMSSSEPACVRDYVHQSGVNGLCVRTEGGGRVIVATGGDDCSLTITCFLLNLSPLTLSKLASWTSSSLHSSVITAVCFVDQWLLCGSGDQRVSLLSWCYKKNHMSAELLAQCCCSVPDIKGLTVISSRRSNFVICVYGNGLEVLQLKEEDR